jgi:hypothetical protein
MPPFIVNDISEHNPALTSAYSRDAIIIRAAFGDSYQDQKFLTNTGQASVMWSRGQLQGGAVLYVPFISPGTAQSHFAYLWKLIGPTVPDWLTGIMPDEESWRGTSYAQYGDKSVELNRFYGMNAQRMGSWKACKGYFNLGDGSALWRNRDRRCGYILADYDNKLVVGTYPGCVGQQYSDGGSQNPVPVVNRSPLPRATVPFGPSDHNIFPTVKNAAQFRALWGRPAWGQKAVPAKPPIAKPKPPAPKPVPKPAPYNPARGTTLVTSDGHGRLLLTDDLRVLVIRDGAIVHDLTKGK